MSPKKKLENKQNPVGNFFERVTHRLIGGTLVRNDEGDILIDDKVTVEVKSSCIESSYGFRLSIEQIEWYSRISMFPFDHGWYVLCAYHNPRLKKSKQEGKPTTALAHHNDVVSIEKYLAQSIAWCLIVDISIIKSWNDTLPHSDKSVKGHPGMETVNLHAKKVVYPFTNGGLLSGMESLGLLPRNFKIFSGMVKTVVELGLYDKYPIIVPVRAVVPRVDAPVLRRAFRRQGFRLREHELC